MMLPHLLWIVIQYLKQVCPLHASLIEHVRVFTGEFLEIFVHPWLFESQLHPSHLVEDLIGEEVHQLRRLFKLLTLHGQHAVNHDLRDLSLILLAELASDLFSFIIKVFVSFNKPLFRMLSFNL